MTLPVGKSSASFALMVSAALGVACYASQTALADDTFDPDADKILKSMSDYMGKLKSYTFSYDVDTEVMQRTGEKLQLSRSGKATIERPGHAHVTRQSGNVDAEMYFDGKQLTLYGKKVNAYVQVDSPGTIDQVIDTLREDLGADAPAADLLYSDAYSNLLIGADSSTYWGTTVTNGVPSHHLSFRAQDVDWQIWIQTGDKPLPLKYVITSKWMAGAPQHSVRIYDWNVDPKVDSKLFTFAPPKDSKKLEEVNINEIGEIAMEEE
jgi:hypothetical protein